MHEITSNASAIVNTPVTNELAQINNTLQSPLWTDEALFWIGVISAICTLIVVFFNCYMIHQSKKQIRLSGLQIDASIRQSFLRDRINLIQKARRLSMYFKKHMHSIDNIAMQVDSLERAMSLNGQKNVINSIAERLLRPFCSSDSVPFERFEELDNCSYLSRLLFHGEQSAVLSELFNTYANLIAILQSLHEEICDDGSGVQNHLDTPEAFNYSKMYLNQLLNELKVCVDCLKCLVEKLDSGPFLSDLDEQINPSLLGEQKRRSV